MGFVLSETSLREIVIKGDNNYSAFSASNFHHQSTLSCRMLGFDKFSASRFWTSKTLCRPQVCTYVDFYVRVKHKEVK